MAGTLGYILLITLMSLGDVNQDATHLARHVMGVEVEGADMLADLLEGSKLFCGGHAQIKHLGGEGWPFSWHIHILTQQRMFRIANIKLMASQQWINGMSSQTVCQ